MKRLDCDFRYPFLNECDRTFQPAATHKVANFNSRKQHNGIHSQFSKTFSYNYALGCDLTDRD